MTRVILDAILRSRLHNLTDPLELCDDSGRVVARVYPGLDLADYELQEPSISDEELRRLEDSKERRHATAQVLGHLEKL